MGAMNSKKLRLGRSGGERRVGANMKRTVAALYWAAGFIFPLSLVTSSDNLNYFKCRGPSLSGDSRFSRIPACKSWVTLQNL